MKEFVKHFKRHPDGSWECISFAEIATITGRIQVVEGSVFKPGTIFMAVDVCRLLDEAEGATDRGKIPISRIRPEPKAGDGLDTANPPIRPDGPLRLLPPTHKPRA